MINMLFVRSAAAVADLSSSDPPLDSKQQRKLRQQQLQQKFRQEMEAKKLQQEQAQQKTPSLNACTEHTLHLKQGVMSLCFSFLAVGIQTCFCRSVRMCVGVCSVLSLLVGLLL